MRSWILGIGTCFARLAHKEPPARGCPPYAAPDSEPDPQHLWLPAIPCATWLSGVFGGPPKGQILWGGVTVSGVCTPPLLERGGLAEIFRA